MTRRTILREPRLLHAAIGATILAAPASVALADPLHSAPAQANPGTGGLAARVKAHRLHYGQAVVVTGRAPSSDSGQTVALDFTPSGSTAWQQVATASVAGTGAFRLTAPLRASGRIKVLMTAAPPATTAFAAGASSAATSSTAPQPVAVSAAIRTRRRSREILGTGTLAIRGQLLPRAPHRRVVLQERRGGRWIGLASGRTGSSGRFVIRYHASNPGREAVRLRFRGDAANAAVTVPAGELSVLRQTVASWYYDAGTTACGFHAYYGVANLSLPCGTKVTLSSGGRTVEAVVDDRGPYVGGRAWDLNQNTAAALGFGGVGTVWSSQ